MNILYFGGGACDSVQSYEKDEFRNHEGLTLQSLDNNRPVFMPGKSSACAETWYVEGD